METILSVGRRKRAIARVSLKAGKGKITINNRDYKNYFPVEQLQYTVLEPLVTLDAINKYDINVNLVGGGQRGQSEAVRLGIARALVKLDAENRKPLKVQGFLTRDSREVERKKPGRPGARKRFQFSKR